MIFIIMKINFYCNNKVTKKKKLNVTRLFLILDKFTF